MTSLKEASFKTGSKVIFNDYWDKLLNEDIDDLFDDFISETFRMIREYEDERAFVLVSTMMLENILDSYLISYIPGFDELRKLKEITFSTKIELAKSLYLSPIDKINAINIIRKIRNRFAHYLPITRLNEIEESEKQSLLDNLKKFENTKLMIDDTSIKTIFEKLVVNVCRMLINYSFHVNLLKRFIRSEEIYDALENFF